MNRITRLNLQYTDDETGEMDEAGLMIGQDFEELDNDSLISQGAALGSLMGLLSERLRAVQLEMKGRMMADGATEYVGPDGTATLKASRSYDAFTLDTLLELLPEHELVDGGALTLAYEKTVEMERRWNMTKLRKFGRRGQAIRDVFDAALTESGHRVEFKPNA